ncbi:MAG: lipid-A-disaccharide synthase [Alphaproteobacteria bacterium]
MSGGESEAPLIYIIAGEPSGDLLGGRLMAALKEETGGRVRFAGVGGEAMTAEGLASLFDLGDIAVMGLVEVLPRIPMVLRRVRQTVADIRMLRPAAVVTIDSWGFTGRVARAIREGGPPTVQIHYVAPMVWAWREHRAAHLAQVVDHLMTLLPNEPPYFIAHGLATTHVGHPVIESGADRGDGPAFRARHGIDPTAPLVCLLPGSRRGETSRLLPVFRQVVEALKRGRPGLAVVVPTVATVAEPVRAAVAGWPVPVAVVQGAAERYDAFAAADAALAASGTVALELALAEVPTVITYRVAPLTAWLFRRVARIRYANLINLILDREVVPELIQERCRPDLLAEAVTRLLDDGSARATQRDGVREALATLGQAGDSPSRRAARLVLEEVRKKEVEAVDQPS